MEKDVEVRIDEHVLARVESAAHSIRRVGGHENADERGGLLARQQRNAHLEPGGRRSRLPEASEKESPVHVGVITNLRNAGEEGLPAAGLGSGARLTGRLVES